MTLVLLCPTEMELEPLKADAGKYGIKYFTCGVGPAMTAYTTTKFLEKDRASCVILAGIGGAYFDHLLDIKKAFVATKEVFADLGRCSHGKIEPVAVGGSYLETSFDLVKEGDQFFQAIAASELLECASMATVSCSSGNRERARTISRLYDAEIENMEGAAAALVCKNYKARLFELRTVSNVAGDTERGNWDIKGALGLLRNGFKEVVQILEGIYRPDR